MPRVPIYRSNANPVSANQLPSVRQTAAPSATDLGGNAQAVDNGLGRGLMQAGGAAMQIVAAEQEHRALQEVMNADLVASRGLNQYVLETRSKQGADAWGITDKAPREIDAILTKAREGLTTDFARQQFDARIAQRHVSALNSVAAWEQEEGRRTSAASLKASSATAIDDAATNYADPAALADARKRLLKGVDAEAVYEGWTPEVATVERAQRLSVMHSGVIGAMVSNGSTDAAAKYLEQHSSELTADHRTRLTATLRTTKDVESAQRFADKAMASGMSELDAIAKARKELSGEAEERAVKEIKQRFVERSAAVERQQRDAADVAAQHYARGGLSAIPPAVWESLDGSRQMFFKDKADSDAYRIETRAAARAGRAAAEESRAYTRAQRERIEAADRTYDDLLTMRATDPDAFASMDLRTVNDFGKLTDSQRKDMAESQAKLRDPAAASNIKAIDAAIEHGAKAIGATGKKASSVELRGQLETYVKQQVADFAADKKRAPTAAELRAIVDNGLVKGDIVKNWRPDSSGYRFQAGERAFEPNLPRVRDDAEYSRLPRGARYLDPQGVERIKR